MLLLPSLRCSLLCCMRRWLRQPRTILQQHLQPLLMVRLTSRDCSHFELLKRQPKGTPFPNRCHQLSTLKHTESVFVNVDVSVCADSPRRKGHAVSSTPARPSSSAWLPRPTAANSSRAAASPPASSAVRLRGARCQCPCLATPRQDQNADRRIVGSDTSTFWLLRARTAALRVHMKLQHGDVRTA